MGFDETMVRQAIQLTNNKDQAIDFIIKTLEDAESIPPPKFKNPQIKVINLEGVKHGTGNTQEDLW